MGENSESRQKEAPGQPKAMTKEGFCTNQRCSYLRKHGKPLWTRLRYPVRVCQHEVVHQVLERLPCERDAQFGHVREVRRTQPPRHMFLAEVHFLRGALRHPPQLYPPL